MRCGAPKSHLLSCSLCRAVGVKRATQSEAALPISPRNTGGVLPRPPVIAGYKGQRIKRYGVRDDDK